MTAASPLPRLISPLPTRRTAAAIAALRAALAVCGLCAALAAWGPAAAAPLSVSDQNIDPASKHSQPVMQVGPSRAIPTLREAARQAQPGTIIEVDAGRYVRDTAVWTQANLVVRAVGGRVTLVAAGASAEGKGIWVVRAENMHVEGFDFEGAAVPSRNGAGIRLESGSLRVRDCSFTSNEMGLLTNDDPGDTPKTTLDIENSEFAHNGRADSHNHQLYVGRIARLSITGSYLHHGRIGHLLKSRAAMNHVHQNRLTDEVGGSASYELEFPDGGVAVVVGNLIAQGSQTQNQHIVAYGAESTRWQRNELYLVNNTLVDNLPKDGIFLRVAPGLKVLRAVNNLMVGNTSDLATPKAGQVFNNFTADWNEFVLAAREDFRLKPGSSLRGKAGPPGNPPSGVTTLVSLREYLHPRGRSASDRPAQHPGALQQ